MVVNTNDHIRAQDLADMEQGRSQVAREERGRMTAAMRELENSLAAASWHRTVRWNERVNTSLRELQTALQETRASANAAGSLFADVVEEEPRLENRVNRIRAEYDDIERQVESLCQQMEVQPTENSEDVEDIRQRLRWLLNALQYVQAKENELLYEAYQIDVGTGD